MKNIEQYLPSKNFRKFILSGLILLAIFALIAFLFNKKEKFVSANNLKISESKRIEDLFKKDTDNDGVYDWEEDLWGTDKTKSNTFGISDKEYIQNKKRELNIKEEIDIEEFNETDRFAREFFSSYAALRSSGEVDPYEMAGFYTALGQKIVESNPGTIKYTESDIKFTNNSQTNNQKYYEQIKNIFIKYRELGMGDEIDLVSDGLLFYINTEQNAVKSGELLLIAESYSNFSEEASKINVPENMKNQHLMIINSASALSKNVFDMSKVINDPLVGLSAISQYETNSENFVRSIEEIERFLGI